MIKSGGNIELHHIAESLYTLADAWADADGESGALPVESVYRAWTEDPAANLPFARSAGHFGGDSALHMSSILDTLGIDAGQLGNLQPDHIAVELNVAGIIAETSPSMLQQFLEDRLDWIGRFEEEALAHAGDESAKASQVSLIGDTRRCIHAVYGQLANVGTWQGHMPISLSF